MNNCSSFTFPIVPPVGSDGSCLPSQSLPILSDFPGEDGCNKPSLPDPCVPCMSVSKANGNRGLSFRQATGSKQQWHTYCSNMAKSGMNPKTLQYLMGHSDIGVTLNTYTHLGLEDAADELKRLEDLEAARKELEKAKGEKPVSQKRFRAT